MHGCLGRKDEEKCLEKVKGEGAQTRLKEF
jgi:hypothetical protein